MSSLDDFTIPLSEIKFVGKGLSRPESVLAEKDGTLWISDSSGGVTRMTSDGAEIKIGTQIGGEANGLAMDEEGNIYISNIGDGKFYKMSRDGKAEVILSEVDGKPLGSPNFVFIDSKKRLWLSVLTRYNPWMGAILAGATDGYIILVDDKGARIVADNLAMCNEIRLDAEEKYLYAAETVAARILRFPVNEDGSLGEREVFGPENLGTGAMVDGFTFDAEGNIWVTTVLRNGLIIINPEGKAHTVFEDPAEVLEAVMAKMANGTFAPEDMATLVGKTIQFPTSVTFAGDDLKTVYMGSLAMPHLLSFQSPVAGRPMYHWR